MCLLFVFCHPYWWLDLMHRFILGGRPFSSLLGVAIDTVAQIESHMLSRHYEGFLKRAVEE